MTYFDFHMQRFDSPEERVAAASQPALVRQNLVKWLHVGYPVFQERMEDIARFHRPVRGGTHATDEVGGLIAEPRSGKTWICKHYARRFPIEVGDDGERYPIVMLEVRDDWTPAHMAESIYRQTGARSVPSMKTTALISGAIKRLVDVRTELLIIDDAHFALLESNKTAQKHYRSIVKGVVDSGRCNVLLSGLPSLIPFVDANDQIGGRGGFPHWYVETLSWDILEEREQFTLLLNGIDRRLPFRLPSDLASARNALHFYNLSGGMIGRVMNIVRDAANRAIDDGSARIMDEHLQAAAASRPRVGDTLSPFKG